MSRSSADLGQEARTEVPADWRLRAFEHWRTMREPHWAHLHYPPLDYGAISYYSGTRAQGRCAQEPG